MLPGGRGQASAPARWDMSAQVSNGSTKPDRLTGPCVQPSSRMVGFNHTCSACVATVFTCSTMSRQRASRAQDAAADVRDRAQADRQDDVGRSRASPRAAGSRRAARRRADSNAQPSRAQARAVDQLVPVGFGGPAGEAVHVDERPVLAAVLHLRLHVEGQRADVGALAVLAEPRRRAGGGRTRSGRRAPGAPRRTARTRRRPCPRASSRRTRRDR